MGSTADEPPLDSQISGSELWAWRQQARQQAIAADLDPAEVDWLLKALADVDALSLRLGDLRTQAAVATRVSLDELQRRWRQRLQQRRPLQHLAGQVCWRDLTLQVSEAVLIPRPETELIVDIALEWLQRQSQSAALERGHWLDLGTGSGAIALALAKGLPHAHLHAVDLSSAALAIARENARLNALIERVQFYQGSWFEPLIELRGKVAAMVSNPPYIPTTTIATLAPEVAQHEPRLALDGGPEGLAAIESLMDAAPDYLASGGLWLVEMMAGQGACVAARLQTHGDYRSVQIIHDLAGRDRFALAVRL